jgi:hypothetical protein
MNERRRRESVRLWAMMEIFGLGPYRGPDNINKDYREEMCIA